MSDVRLPSPVLISLIRLYCYIYKPRLEEMKGSISQMSSFNEFFTRELKPGLRPIDDSPKSVTSPVDGTIAQFGNIKNGLLVQSKGIQYSLTDLIGEKDATRFERGYFITFYLSPADYHRIHAPVAGSVKSFSYFSGNLWPVNYFAVSKIRGLFSLNERIVTPIEMEKATVTLVKIGATIVGKIKLDYSDLTSNRGGNTRLGTPVVPARHYKKGDEIGRFQLGSTVILLFENKLFAPLDLYEGRKVKTGQAIGYL